MNEKKNYVSVCARSAYTSNEIYLFLLNLFFKCLNDAKRLIRIEIETILLRNWCVLFRE